MQSYRVCLANTVRTGCVSSEDAGAQRLRERAGQAYMLLLWGPAESSAAVAVAAALSMASRSGALSSMWRSLFKLLSKLTIRSRWPACCWSNLRCRTHTNIYTLAQGRERRAPAAHLDPQELPLVRGEDVSEVADGRLHAGQLPLLLLQ